MLRLERLARRSPDDASPRRRAPGPTFVRHKPCYYSSIMRGISSSVFGVGILISTLGAVHAGTSTLIVPKEAEISFGSTFADPFFGYSYVEQIYAASEFSALPADIITLTEVAFRVNESSLEALDVVIPRVQLLMNVFSGSMQEAVDRQSGVEAPVVVVLDGRDVHLTGRAGQVQAYDVRLPFQTSFAYDRRLGQLVLSILTEGGYSGKVLGMDAYGMLGEFDRGAHILTEPLGQRRARAIILATEFVYQMLSATIDAIRRVADSIQIDFSVVGEPRDIIIEGSEMVTGPYTVEGGAELTATGEGKMRAIIPMSSNNRFYRVRLS